MKHAWLGFLMATALAAPLFAQPAELPDVPSALAAKPSPAPAEGPWITNYAAGMKQARETKRPVLIDFWAEWCGPCKLMDRQTWRDPAITAQLPNFICIKIEIDQSPDAARAWRVNGIPRIILLNVHNQVIGDHLGFLPSDDLAPILEKAAATANDLLSEAAQPPAEAAHYSGETAAPQSAPIAIQLAAAGDDALTSGLVQIFSLPDPALRRAEIDLLAPQADRLRPVLVRLLSSERLAVRVGALEALEKIAPSATPAPAFDPWAPHRVRSEALARFILPPKSSIPN